MRFLVLIAIVAGCQSTEEELALEDRLRRAFPTEEILAITLPADSAAEKPGNGALLEIGARSGYFDLSKTVGGALDRGMRAVAGPIRRALRGVATAGGPKRRLWKSTDAAGEVFMAADEVLDGHIRYSVAVRTPKGKWAPLVAGTVTRGKHGTRGAIWIDLRYDASPKTGRYLGLYDFDDEGGERTVTVYSYGDSGLGSDGPNPAPTRVFHFQGSRQSGVFVFTSNVFDLDQKVLGKGDPERALAITRWNQQGGRTDVIAAGGDLEAAGYASGRGSECWSAPAFKAQYATVVGRAEDGAETVLREVGDSTACAFAEPEVPVLPDPAPPPPDPELPAEADV